MINTWLIILYLVVLILAMIGFKYLSYYIVLPGWLGKVLLIIALFIPLGFGVMQYQSKYKSFDEFKVNMEFKSNQDSEYSQLWLDYLSFRDSEIGRLGSVTKFEAYLESKGLSEKEYAEEVIRDMLLEQGITDENIAIKCVEENLGYGEFR